MGHLLLWIRDGNRSCKVGMGEESGYQSADGFQSEPDDDGCLCFSFRLPYPKSPKRMQLQWSSRLAYEGKTDVIDSLQEMPTQEVVLHCMREMLQSHYVAA